MMVKTFLSFRFKFIAPLKFNITDEIEKQNCKRYIPAHISNSYYHTFTIKLTLLLRVKGMKTTHVMFCFCFLWWLVLLFEWVKRGVYAINTTKMMKNKIKTANILIISHRFDVTDWKYFKISLCAASTFMTASSVFESILKNKRTN